MERPRNIFEALFSKEKPLQIGFSEESKAFLKKLLLRPNPTLAEFAFLCLGTNNYVDTVLVANEHSYSTESGLNFKGFIGSSVSRNELTSLIKKLDDSGRYQELLIFGHSHPSGSLIVKNIRFSVAPNESLLVPSMGTKEEGGPTAAHDLAFISSLVEVLPELPIPFVGIAANTENGPALRAYDTKRLLKIKRAKDIDKVPQTTIKL